MKNLLFTLLCFAIVACGPDDPYFGTGLDDCTHEAEVTVGEVEMRAPFDSSWLDFPINPDQKVRIINLGIIEEWWDGITVRMRFRFDEVESIYPNGFIDYQLIVRDSRTTHVVPINKDQKIDLQLFANDGGIEYMVVVYDRRNRYSLEAVASRSKLYYETYQNLKSNASKDDIRPTDGAQKLAPQIRMDEDSSELARGM